MRLLAGLALAIALAGSSTPSVAAESPQLTVPARADSAPGVTIPSPLIVPGRPVPGETPPLTAAQKALQEYEKGLGLERTNAFGAAITAYRLAARLDPTLRGPNARVGALFVRVGEWQEAAAAYAAEVTRAPDDLESARQLGLALANAGDSVRAVRQLELLVRRRPRDGEMWQALGFGYGRFGRNADAERALRRAVQLAPRDADAWRDLGVILGRTDRPKDAIAAFGRAIAIDPKDATACLDRANVEMRAGDAAAALADYQKAEQRDTMMTAAYDGQLRALTALGRPADAGAVYRRWLARMPAATEVRLAAVDHFRSLRRTDMAVEVARDGVRQAPRSSEASLLLGTALGADGQFRAALETLRRAQSLARDSLAGARAERFVAVLRAGAPDSLRAWFAADSVAHASRPAGVPGAMDAPRKLR